MRGILKSAREPPFGALEIDDTVNNVYKGENNEKNNW